MDNPIEAWGWKIALRKVTTIVGKMVASAGAAVAVEKGLEFGLAHAQPLLDLLAKYGGITVNISFTVDPVKMQAGLGVLAVAGLEMAHDWAKLKWPDKIKF